MTKAENRMFYFLATNFPIDGKVSPAEDVACQICTSTFGRMIEDRARIKFCGSPGCCALVSAVSSDLFNGFQGSVACVVGHACCSY